MNLSELKFKPGNTSDSIIVGEPLGGGFHESYDQGNLNFYGGYVVCESVHPAVKSLLLAAPELLQLLKDIDQTLAEWSLSGFLQYGKSAESNDKWLDGLEQVIQNTICEIEPDYLLERE